MTAPRHQDSVGTPATASLPNKSFVATPEAQARVLLLIDGFSRNRDQTPRHLEGRLKLAKLDFLLRYPSYLLRVLEGRNIQTRDVHRFRYQPWLEGPIDARMVRYRYGPWDPAYYAILGSLVGRQLIVSEQIPGRAHAGYRTTATGEAASRLIRDDDSFAPIVAGVALLRTHLDLQGTTLKNLVYQIPQVVEAQFNEEVS